MITKARVLKTIRSQINSLRNTLLPRQSGAVEGEVYSNAGEAFQRSAGSIVQVTEEGRVIEAPDVRLVEGIATAISNQRTSELEAILAEGVGAEYLSGYYSGTMVTSNVVFDLTPTITAQDGFALSGNKIVCTKAGRYAFVAVCRIDGTASAEATATIGIKVNGVGKGQVSSKPPFTASRNLYWDVGTISFVAELEEDDEITCDTKSISTTAFATTTIIGWCISERKAAGLTASLWEVFGGVAKLSTPADIDLQNKRLTGLADGIDATDGATVGQLANKISRSDLIGDIALADLKTEISSRLTPPNVFYVSTKAELLAALAADGDRVVEVTVGGINVDTGMGATLTIGTGLCSVYGVQIQFVGDLTWGAGVAGVVQFHNITGWGGNILVNQPIYASEIYPSISVGASFTGGSFYYEKADQPNKFVGAQQSFWRNTFSVLPQTITSTELADDAVTTAKIADEAVTTDKLATAVSSKLLPTPTTDDKVLKVSTVDGVKVWGEGDGSSLDGKIYAVQTAAEFREAAEADGDRTIILQQPVTSIDDDLTFGGGNCSIIAPYAAHTNTGPTLYIADDITIDGSQRIIFDGHLGISTNDDTNTPYTLTLNVPMYVASCSGGTVVNAPLYTMSNNDFYFESKTQGNVVTMFWKAGWGQFNTVETTEITDVFDLTSIPDLTSGSKFYARKQNGMVHIEAHLLCDDPINDSFNNLTIPLKTGWQANDVERSLLLHGLTSSDECVVSGAIGQGTLSVNNPIGTTDAFAIISLNLDYACGG